MSAPIRFLIGFAAAFFTVSSVPAASLRVAPVTIDVTAPAAASSIRVWNDAREPLNVQVRVFKWTQRNGKDVYEATRDVVASPPFTLLRPGAENIIRVVRTSKRPVQGEESYRLVVDELPNSAKPRGNTINLLIRHSIPVFFTASGIGEVAPSFAVERRNGGYLISVRNGAAEHLKISNLSLSGGGGTLARREGLVGYVLGHSTARWFVPGKPFSGHTVAISANGDTGPLNATVRLQGR